MKSIMLLGLAWAIVICATPSLADHFQSQSGPSRTAFANSGQSYRRAADRVVCRQDGGQVMPARFDRLDATGADREPVGRQFAASFTTYCD